MGTISGIGGPPIALAYLGLTGPALRATLARYFLVGNLVAIPTLILVGSLDHRGRPRVPRADPRRGARVPRLRLAGPTCRPRHVRPIVLGLSTAAAVAVIIRTARLGFAHERRQPIDVVRRFCDAWGDGDLDDDRRLLQPTTPCTTTSRWHRWSDPSRSAPPSRASRGGVEKIEFRVDNIAADGGTVLTERHDIFTFANGEIDLPVMGTFEVDDGKITAWRDYFDMNQFMSQMPA